jgi:hypothetical protein
VFVLLCLITATFHVYISSLILIQENDYFDNVYVNRNFKLTPIIGRAARLARFIRPSAAVKISRSLNILNIIQKVRTWWNRNSRSRTMNWLFHRLCFCFGSCYERHLERDDAAVVIQRAWLKYNGYNKLPDKRRSLASYRSMKNMSRLSTAGHRRGEGKKSKSKNHEDSQVGAAMRELTAQRIVIFIMVALFLTVLMTYREYNASAIEAMKMLHHQTFFSNYSNSALAAVRESILPTMYMYNFSNGSVANWTLEDYNMDDLRNNEKMNITIYSTVVDEIMVTSALVVIRELTRWDAIVGILWGLAIIIFWYVVVSKIDLMCLSFYYMQLTYVSLYLFN